MSNRPLPLAVLAVCALGAVAAAADLAELAHSRQWQAIKAMGPEVMPRLVELYTAGNEDQRTAIAQVFYSLGWKSEDAKRALLRDVRTANRSLRLQVQWALGRVSDDPMVVDILLENLQHDDNPLFRDKAACALAHDQIHLTPAQKVRLFEGLIQALEDPKHDVRRIAALALQIHTGQTKGFTAGGQAHLRQEAIQRWRQWLEEYRSQL